MITLGLLLHTPQPPLISAHPYISKSVCRVSTFEIASKVPGEHWNRCKLVHSQYREGITVVQHRCSKTKLKKACLVSPLYWNNVFFYVFIAARGPAGGVSVPVPALVGISRCPWLQKGFPQPAHSSTQVAEGLWRRTHCCPLPVSNLLSKRIVHCKLRTKEWRQVKQSLSKGLELELVMQSVIFKSAVKTKLIHRGLQKWSV